VRNRLIAAFAQVVVVVESAVTGGSMSTVAEALDRDRAVMAVPGPLGRSTSEGCHELLRDGAEICTSADDVLAMLDLGADTGPSRLAASGFARRGRASPSGTKELVEGRQSPRGRASGSGSGSSSSGGLEARVLEELAGAPLTLDSMTLRCGASLAEVSEAVAGLEASGELSVRGGWLERTSVCW
jgi:DNA processing protein